MDETLGLLSNLKSHWDYSCTYYYCKLLNQRRSSYKSIYQNKIENDEDNKNVDKPLIEDDLQVQNKSDAAAGPEFSTKVFSQHQSFSPTSSEMSPNGNSSAAIVGRKRRSRDEVVDDISGEPSGTRKSLRGAGVKSTRGKRPKVAVVSNV